MKEYYAVLIKIFVFMTTFIALGAIGKSNSFDFKFPKMVEPHNEIRVMLVDTGIGSHHMIDPYLDKQSVHEVDNHGHGTHVAGIVLYGDKLNDPVCKEVKLLTCKFFDKKVDPKERTGRKMINCVKRATHEKVRYLNVSGGGTDFQMDEYLAFRDFQKSGGISIVAAGNDGQPISNQYSYFPASYRFGTYTPEIMKKPLKPLKSIIVVQNMNSDGSIIQHSNTHPDATAAVGVNVTSTMPNDQYGPMTGTSQATAVVLHTILKQRCEEISKSMSNRRNSK